MVVECRNLLMIVVLQIDFDDFGSGSLIQLLGIQSVGLTAVLQKGCTLMISSSRLSYGGRISPWRSWCLLDGFFGRDCQLRQIYFEEGLFLMSLKCVLLVVVYRNQSIIYFWLVVSLVRFGRLLGIDFAFIQRIHLTFLIIFISLALLQVMLNQGVLLCIWFSCLALGWFGRK